MHIKRLFEHLLSSGETRRLPDAASSTPPSSVSAQRCWKEGSESESAEANESEVLLPPVVRPRVPSPKHSERTAERTGCLHARKRTAAAFFHTASMSAMPERRIRSLLSCVHHLRVRSPLRAMLEHVSSLSSSALAAARTRNGSCPSFLFLRCYSQEKLKKADSTALLPTTKRQKSGN